MKPNILPMGSAPQALPAPHFPTPGQAVIWRNWEMVPIAHLARALRTTDEDVLEAARLMGLRVPPLMDERWLDRGYNTILRANWHLLPYDQLLDLLSWTTERLAYTLKEDDFMWVKLGELKPTVLPVRLTSLTPEERERTLRLATCLREHFPDLQDPEPAAPFSFLERWQAERLPERQVFDPPVSGDIVVDGRWRIAVPAGMDRIQDFARRFIAAHEARWGHRLSLAGASAGAPTIAVVIKEAADLPAESHAVSISGNSIRVTGVDATGILRGLQWLERRMEERGGPYLKPGTIQRKTRFDLRLVYPYFTPHGDPLGLPGIDPCPDGLLQDLSASGVNGIWLQGILYTLAPWDVAPELSCGWEGRLARLRDLTHRAGRYGIGVYLYLNEPRGLSLAFYKEHPDLMGMARPGRGVGTLCTSQPAVLQFLRNSTRFIFEAVPELAGVFTITGSENPTSCYSVRNTDCPRCLKRQPEEVIAEVNRVIAEGVHAARPTARVIVWTWGWQPSWQLGIIDRLPPDVEVMATSEEAMPTMFGGVPGEIWDYSISIPGPGERARSVWQRARARGLKTVAKVQINNSWECASVPYLPVFQLMDRHLQNITEEPVDGLMLAWTLGGCPSPVLRRVADFFWDDGTPVRALPEFAQAYFGPPAHQIVAACEAMSHAFTHFPFHWHTLYQAPHCLGPANPLYAEPTGYFSTMVGFPYDALERWRTIYPEDVFEEQFRKLVEGWSEGLRVLGEATPADMPAQRAAMDDLTRIATAAFLHFRSAFLQIRFIRLRTRWLDANAAGRAALRSPIADILREEISLARRLHDLLRVDSRIGFEATQHYYYTLQHLREKVVNCAWLLERYRDMPA